MRIAIASSGVVVLGLAIANSAAARQPAVRSDMLVAPSAVVEWISAVTSREIEQHRRHLNLNMLVPQIPIEQQAKSQIRLASASQEWTSLFSKTGINQLPRLIKRSLENFATSSTERSSAGRRRKSTPGTKSFSEPAIATAAWQATQMGVERIAIPQPRPSRASTSAHAQAIPTVSVSGQSDRLLFAGHAMLGMMMVCFALAVGVVLARYRINTRLVRERAEKAIYDAIAGLPLKGSDFRNDVSTILKEVERVYGFFELSLISLQPMTLEAQSVYCSNQQPHLQKELIEDAVSEIRSRGTQLSDITLWRYPNLAPGPSETGRGMNSKIFPEAVASVVWLGNHSGAMLVAQCRPGRRARLTDDRKLQLVTHLLGIVVEGQYRPRAMTTQTIGGAAEELAGSIAHEFNNLLMSMMGYAEMAADALNPGSSPRAYVERIQSAGERAKCMIDQTLTFSKRQRSPVSSLDVVAATAEILPDLKMCIPSSADFRASLPNKTAHIHGSPTALQQAIINLCKNAGEATMGGGTITLSVTVIDQSYPRAMTHGQIASGRYVRVSVADTGSGIPTSDLRQIFDPFFTTRSGEGGTGLGLATVLRIVKHLNGGLNVRSAPGLGTRFDLFFPCLSEVSTRLQNWATGAAE
ncbi:ATP-binding protein [Ensifer sp. YR511]|uniref:ATP-binding protein n=1 Tax=Ensifer sp. YR511 TaxID=1855294 RepID=UPI0008920F19|nr:ATP-binding protein [Ensifer sp. YR511]SDN97348.1 Signal transduction histidine kinase [Ensifer sp. YR511]